MSKLLSGVLNDLRYTWCRYSRRPAQALWPVAVMAAGIATSSAIFLIVQVILLRPLPYPNADRLVAVYRVHPEERLRLGNEESWNRGLLSWFGWQSLKSSDVFDGVGAWLPVRPMIGHPIRDTANAWYVSTSMLELTGAKAALGRLFTAQEETDPSSDVVVLSRECWLRRYGGRLDIVGTTETFSLFVGEPKTNTIIGVLEGDFGFRGNPPDYLLPLGQRTPLRKGTADFFAIGRLANSTTLARADAAVRAIVPPSIDDPGTTTSRAVPLRDDLLGESVTPSWLLAGTAGILLLAACASVSGQFISEARLRNREIAVRLALGATNRTVVRQLLVEHLARIVLAMIIAAPLTALLAAAVMATAPAGLFGNQRLDFSASTLASGAVAAGLTALALGVVPLLFVSQQSTKAALGDGGQSSTARQRRHQLFVVSAQMGVSLVLLVCAALLAQTFRSLNARPLGFDPTDLVIATIQVTEAPQSAQIPGQSPVFTTWIHTEGLLDALRRLPGVVDAAGVAQSPFSGPLRTIRIRLDSSTDDGPEVQVQSVTPTYFQVMGIPMLAGRGLEPRDRRTTISASVEGVLISRELQRILGSRAIGRKFFAARTSLGFEVVGVVGNVRHRRFSDRDLPTFYALGSSYGSSRHILVKATGTSVLPSLRTAITTYDSTILVPSVTRMKDLVAASLAQDRFRAALSGLLGVTALLLAAFGMYALGARLVSDRSRELAILSALGANSFDLSKVVLRPTLTALLAALAGGVPASVAAAFVMRRYLFGVTAFSLKAIFFSGLLMAVSMLLALLRPMRRAAAVDPAVMLRR